MTWTFAYKANALRTDLWRQSILPDSNQITVKFKYSFQATLAGIAPTIHSPKRFFAANLLKQKIFFLCVLLLNYRIIKDRIHFLYFFNIFFFAVSILNALSGIEPDTGCLSCPLFHKVWVLSTINNILRI